YIGMHVHMKASSDPLMELVMRRTQVDEFIVRPAGSSTDTNGWKNDNGGATPQIAGPQTKTSRNPIIWILATACVILLAYILTQDSNEYIGDVQAGRLKDVERHKYPEKVQTGEYLTETEVKIKFKNASTLSLTPETRINITNPNRIFLEKGSLKFIQESEEKLNLSTNTFKLLSPSKSIAVTQNSNSSEIKVNSSNKFIPNRWRPKHYWSFDDASDTVLDSSGEAHGTVGRGIEKAKGLIGSGAYKFSDKKSESIRLGTGGGIAPGTGTFAVVDGVTIEALVKTDWNGNFMNSDEIFRKDHSKNGDGEGDGALRMLFCFQNDYGKKHVFPKDYKLPTLSFGLYLVGQGYHELKLPLDGLDGRPTLEMLKNGKAQHLVATYDVRTGKKAIYINGRQLIFHQYQPGTKVLSGGPGLAVIGNIPENNSEAFNGLIDEVAFYDFALPPYMVKYHFDNTQKGNNYFGLTPNAKKLPEKLSLNLPENEIMILDPLTGLPVSIKK
ncbi:MAG: LamG domain-containing protein, partial [Lentisphaeraceae bacterium]|nr:LamG domain-containing protein [Lentisphaeraceae bacterium]